jgi:integrase
MQLKHGAYYYVLTVGKKKKWIRLSDEYGAALNLWADYEGQRIHEGETVGSAIDRYLVETLRQKSPRTQTDYMAYSTRIREVFGDVHLDDVKKTHIAQYLDRRKNKNGDPAPVAANREIAMLSSVYQQAIRWGWTERNPCRGVTKNSEKRRTRHVTEEEIVQLKQNLDEQMQCIVDLVLLTALRKSDVLRLRLSDLIDEGLEVNVSKTGRVLVFQWTDELRRAIDRVRSLRRRIGSLYLFSTRKGLPYKVSGFDSIWQRAVKRSGLSNLTFHDLRAKALTDAQKKHGRDYAQLLADHESGNTTERYIRGRERRTVLPLK